MSTQIERRDLRCRDLCFLDVETTGTRFGFHEIIEIGAVRTTPDGLSIRGTWSARIRPCHPERISSRAREVNGFSELEWATAREPTSALWLEFAAFADGCVPIAHNPSFDRAFIALSAAAAGVLDLKMDYHWIGTESLAWPSYLAGQLKEMSLDGICDLFGIQREPTPHRAINGAMTCNMAYRALTTPPHELA